jgi:hypothetical protein
MESYIFAERPGLNILLIKASEKWVIPIIDCLIDNQFILTSAGEGHWNRQIDVIGRPALCFEFENEDQCFDIVDIENRLIEFTEQQLKI